MEKNKLQRSQLLLPRAAQLAQREPKCFMVLSISFDFPSCLAFQSMKKYLVNSRFVSLGHKNHKNNVHKYLHFEHPLHHEARSLDIPFEEKDIFIESRGREQVHSA